MFTGTSGLWLKTAANRDKMLKHKAFKETRKNVFADKNEAALMKKCEVICKRCQDMHDNLIRNRKCKVYCIVYVTIFNKLKNDHSFAEVKL